MKQERTFQHRTPAGYPRRRRRSRKKLRRQRMIIGLLLVLAVVLILLFSRCSQEAPTPIDTAEDVEENETTILQPITEESRITISVMGDMMAHSPIITSASRGNDKYDFSSNFSYIAPYIQKADFAVANLETTLAGNQSGYEYSGFPNFNCPDAIVGALKNAGFDMLLTANNHSNDTGASGMLRTVQTVREQGMLSLGVTENEDELPYLVQNIQGISVGMICYTYGSIDSDTGTKAVNQWPVNPSMNPCINVFDPRKPESFYGEVSGYIANLKKQGVDTILFFIHWGDEYQLTPSAQQKKIAQKLCDLGADVIIGSHPHVVQPIELLSASGDSNHKTLCVYSLGNALSNQRADKMDLDTGHTEDGLLLNLTFVKYTDGSIYLDSVEALPTWVYVRYGDVYRSYDILPLDMSVADWKSALNIGNTNLEYAKASYQRTMDQIASGLDEVEAYLKQQREQRPR